MGQGIGMFLGFGIPVLLTSEEFCNKYLRIIPDTGGVVTMKSKPMNYLLITPKHLV